MAIGGGERKHRNMWLVGWGEMGSLKGWKDGEGYPHPF